MVQAIPIEAIKGRGSASRLPHRFERVVRVALEDAEQSEWDEESSGRAPTTELWWEEPRSAISRNDSPDIHFEQGLNPYRGCEHGCVYCYARPTHSYLGRSPGLDFETRILAKANLAEVLRRELMNPRYRVSPIVIGSATDAYQPVERKLGITREVLELLNQCHHPLAIVTKGSGVGRDIELLASMAKRRLASVYVTVTTLDPDLARTLEPRAASPQRRLQVIRDLTASGIPTGVSVAPQIPFVNDDMEAVLEAAALAGARTAFYSVIRLPWEVDAVFEQWLGLHMPLRAHRVMARIREMRGGRNYDSDFQTRMQGQGIWADLIRQRFEKACGRFVLNRERSVLDNTLFRPELLGLQQSLF